ncbi:transcriptional repressor BetI [Slackia heliotrinireducens]|uniref:Transcriptional regulator n=1 Tax=Slackia heliotrinireducens (strain ATCC 29202 / DSM 20476 / NCTC 11029 / RHS 1) TaxID=471855 RepID=C7N422_SLAHD|nr:TetR/AcrR family transcriptional regulator [Slackia heliotrinireducens]ACV23758.1 transcriptional regulator [Slackia heliotrinireducens DSM 20476]VEH03383.1 transcriptional repressor BetI [Slackia heliotrinireducens]
MATSSEEQTSREQIQSAAFKLMLEEGYKQANYTRISAESGQGRPLVQYYFPKKEDMAVALVLEILRGIAKALETADVPGEAPELRIMHMGQVYYSFLLRDAQTTSLTFDLLSDRGITGRIVKVNAEESLPLYSVGQDEDAAVAMREASIKATGGVYEMLWLRIKEKTPVDPADLSAQNTAAFLALVGASPYVAAYDRLMAEKIDQAVVDSLVESVRRGMLA